MYASCMTTNEKNDKARWADCGFCGGPMLVGIDGRCIACDQLLVVVLVDPVEKPVGDLTEAEYIEFLEELRAGEEHDLWGPQAYGTGRQELRDEGLL